MEHTTQTIALRPYKLKELINIYGVSRRTLLGWISKYQDEIGERTGHYYTIAQVKIIFERLSVPSDMITKNTPD
jgi:uncharacterized protein YjcR